MSLSEQYIKEMAKKDREEQNRKRKIYKIDEEDFLDLLSGKLKIKDIPEGTELISCEYNKHQFHIEILTRNEQFEVIPKGEEIKSCWAEIECLRKDNHICSHNGFH